MTKIVDYSNPSLLFAEGAAPATPSSATVRIYAKADGQIYSKDDAGVETQLGVSGGGGTGNVVGPASATDGAVALYDGTTGKLLKNGVVLGSAAATDASDYATSAQGTKADSATQPGNSVTTLTMSTAKILGRSTASTGAVEEITVGTGLSLSGGTLAATGAGGSGDVVGPAGATSGNLAVFDGATGKLIKDGGPIPASLTNPMTTLGDLIVGGASGAAGRVGIGTTGQVWTVVSGAPAWAAPGGGGITAMNEQTGTSYTLVLADATKGVRCTNAAAIALTIPPNSSVAIPVLSGIPAFQGGAGVITVTAGAGVTLESPNGVATSAVGDFRTMFQRATNIWVIG